MCSGSGRTPSKRPGEDSLRVLSGMYQPGWSPEEVRSELREVEAGLEAWLGLAKRDKDVLGGCLA
jgi:hypothetical protein